MAFHIDITCLVRLSLRVPILVETQRYASVRGPNLTSAAGQRSVLSIDFAFKPASDQSQHENAHTYILNTKSSRQRLPFSRRRAISALIDVMDKKQEFFHCCWNQSEMQVLKLVVVVVFCAVIALSSTEAKRKRKFEGDFEFAEEVRVLYLHLGSS